MTNKYTITAALPYANGPLHLGHVAGVYLPADTFVRFLRMNDADVLFVCGSDEHGAAITLRAKKEGVSPREIVDKYHNLIGNAFKDFGIEFDIYDRTSSAIHHQTSSNYDLFAIYLLYPLRIIPMFLFYIKNILWLILH